jgi:ketosteroid isomerase-like protein
VREWRTCLTGENECSRRHRKKHSFAGEAFNRHDVDGILEFWKEGAITVCEPGRLATGKEAQRGVYENFWDQDAIAKQEKISVAGHSVVDLEVERVRHSAEWAPFSGGGVGSAALRRHSDGGWRVVVESRSGPAVLD